MAVRLDDDNECGRSKTGRQRFEDEAI